MQAKQDNTRDNSNYYFILKCMGALAASSALIAGVYWLTKAAPLVEITAKTLFTFAGTTTSLPAVLALVGIIALFCIIPFAGGNNYYPQTNVHNGYTSGYSFWQPAPVHTHVHTTGGHFHDHSHVHGGGGHSHQHSHSSGGGHSAGMGGHSHGHH